MADTEPPSYTFSGPAPDYSLSPEEEETTLERTPRWHGLDNQPDTTPFLKSWPQGVKVTLPQYHRDQLSSYPTYTRNGYVTGEVEIQDRESVLEVVACLYGKLDISVTNGSGCHLKVVREQITLWKADISSSPSTTCPAILPLSLQFPSTYRYNGDHQRIPPSYDFASYALVVLMASCSYSLVITISRSRKSKLKFWKPSESYHIPLCYRPRTRPIRPLLPESTALAYIKVCPEEFLQISMSVSPKHPESTHPPLHCQFLLPSVQTFCITDSIPCHIQIQGPISSLREFFVQADIKDMEECANSNRKGKQKKQRLNIGTSKPLIRMFIARQIFIDIMGRKSWRTITIGEATDVMQDSPQYDITTSTASPDEVVTLDWSGLVQCNKDVSTVGFISGPLTVKDFLVFSLTPAYAATSKYNSLHRAHPIRLVTDPWHDDTLIHPDDHT